jgi:hypothetical protein
MFFETLTIAILIFILQQIADLKKKILNLSLVIENLKKEV